MLTRSEQTKIKGGAGPTDFYLYCSADNVNWTVYAGPWNTKQLCIEQGLWVHCGISCNFTKCTGDTLSCA